MSNDLKNKILMSNDAQVERLYIEEWDTTLYVKTMSAKEKDAYDESISNITEEGVRELTLENFKAKLLVRVLCSDPEGKQRIFTDKEAEALGEKSSKVIDRCWKVAKKLNAITGDSEVSKK